MKVLLLSTYGKGGGAAIAARRLLHALNENGTEARMLVRDGALPEQRIEGLFPGILQKPLFLWDKFSEKLAFLNQEKDKSVRFAFSSASGGRDISHHPLVQEADVLHLHWVQHGFLSMENLTQLARLNKPVVWTLHDQWVFTGGCHYPRGCRHFEDKCGNCPMLRAPASGDLSRKLWEKKAHTLEGFSNLVMVACSDWLRNEASNARMMRPFRIESIPNPIDAHHFFPEDQKQARKRFGIPEDRFVILFVAQNIRDPRKGFQYLERALQQLPPERLQNTTLLLMGKDSPENLNFPTVSTGSLSEAGDIRLTYSAADVLVTPSLEDNLPNTIMEAMACGRPVIAFRTGGIPEMIRHEETGWLAEPGYEQGLTEGILWMAQPGQSHRSGAKALEFAREHYSPETVAARYTRLYEELLGSGKATR